MAEDRKGQAAERITVPVRIMGESFLVTGQQEEGFVLSLAKELDGRLTSARKLMPGASPNRVAISIALELLAEIRAEKGKTQAVLEAFERT